MAEGGYPSTLFLAEPSEHLLCSICLEVMKTPIQCPQGHSFCRSCILSTLASTSKCPMDRLDLQADSLVLNISLAGIIDNLEIKCPLSLLPQEQQASKKRKSKQPINQASYSGGTCSWTGSLEQIEHHKGECVLAICECPNEECRRSMPRGDLPAHAELCPASPVVCDFCAVSHPRRAGPAHSRTCPRAPVRCPNRCGAGPDRQTLVPREELAAHRSDRCPLEPRPCPHAGCPARVVRRDLEAHARAHLVEEKERLAERVAALGAEAEEHRARSAALQARRARGGAPLSRARLAQTAALAVPRAAMHAHARGARARLLRRGNQEGGSGSIRPLPADPPAASIPMRGLGRGLRPKPPRRRRRTALRMHANDAIQNKLQAMRELLSSSAS